MTEDRSYESKAKSHLHRAGSAYRMEENVVLALQGIGYAILHLAEVWGEQKILVSKEAKPIRTPERDQQTGKKQKGDYNAS